MLKEKNGCGNPYHKGILSAQEKGRPKGLIVTGEKWKSKGLIISIASGYLSHLSGSPSDYANSYGWNETLFKHCFAN